MGACTVGGSFVDSDWRTGIEQVIEDCLFEYGHDGYNGTASTVSFRYGGDKSGLTKKQLEKYIEDTLNRLDKRDGEVIKVATKNYCLIKTKYEEKAGLKHVLCDSKIKEALRHIKRPCMLVTFDHLRGDAVIKESGTITELKKKAHDYLRKEKYCRTYYIVRKGTDKCIVCNGDYKNQKKTSKKTDEKTLVLEMSKYRYFGWAAC